MINAGHFGYLTRVHARITTFSICLIGLLLLNYSTSGWIPQLSMFLPTGCHSCHSIDSVNVLIKHDNKLTALMY